MQLMHKRYDVWNTGIYTWFVTINKLHVVSVFLAVNKKLSYRLELGRQQCISLQLSYFLSP